MLPLTMPDPTTTAAQVIGGTKLCARVYARLVYDNPHGRGWEVYVDVDGTPETVATASADKRFGSAAFAARVNWSAWGAQRPSVTANFAEALDYAAGLAMATKIALDTREA